MPDARNTSVDFDARWTVDLPALAATVADALIVVDADGRIQLANEVAEQLFGVSASELLDNSAETLIPNLLTQSQWAAARTQTPSRARAGEAPAIFGRRHDGSEFPVDVSLLPLRAGDDVRIVLLIRDATSRRLGERAAWVKRELEEHLTRIQRLEAIGRLAGGVAHDFNNILQVIGGHAEQLLNDSEEGTSQHKLLLDIRRASDRAGLLTRQLLAFGRRQVLRPQVLDLNAVVQTLETMLHRVIGENIQLATTFDNALRSVQVDPGQIEQVVLNLVVNSRDAIGGHAGTIEIETRNLDLREPMVHRTLPVQVPAGQWVLVSVRDTGSGMDAETVSRAFEPFFTTKDVSSGSGLGLSTVYGIVKQSGGYVWIQSTPRLGTTVSFVLPAVDGAPESLVTDHMPRLASTVAPGHATILLAEDDEAVRELLAAFLRDSGYRVIEAYDGESAFREFERVRDEIDLLITDVVMPNGSGPSLARAARETRPGIQILYLSGYANDGDSGDLDPRDAYLQKPVSRTDLLARVAELIRQP